MVALFEVMQLLFDCVAIITMKRGSQRRTGIVPSLPRKKKEDGGGTPLTSSTITMHGSPDERYNNEYNNLSNV